MVGLQGGSPFVVVAVQPHTIVPTAGMLFTVVAWPSSSVVDAVAVDVRIVLHWSSVHSLGTEPFVCLLFPVLDAVDCFPIRLPGPGVWDEVAHPLDHRDGP